MNTDHLEQMRAIHAMVEEHKIYMLEHSHGLGATGQAMYWLCVLDKATEVLQRMDCPPDQIIAAVNMTLSRNVQK